MELNRELVIKDLEWKKLASSRMGSVTVSAEQIASYYTLIEELIEENERFRDENTLLLNFMLPDYEIPGMMRTQINLPKEFASANIPANKYCISGRALKESLKKVKSDIVREFSERLKAEKFYLSFLGDLVYVEDIERIEKEMVGK